MSWAPMLCPKSQGGEGKVNQAWPCCGDKNFPTPQWMKSRELLSKLKPKKLILRTNGLGKYKNKEPVFSLKKFFFFICF